MRRERVTTVCGGHALLNARAIRSIISGSYLRYSLAGSIWSVALIFTLTIPLHAQSPDSPKFEAGFGYSLLRTNFLDQFDKTESGIAAHLGYSLSDHITLEAELNLFPQNLEAISKGMVAGLFGPKVGWRSERVGIFGKIRPGLVHFQRQSHPFPCPAVVPPFFVCALALETDFALDAGGVLEYYPQSRVTLRLDAADLMIRFPGPYFPNGVGSPFWRHNFAFGTSVGFRF